VIYYQRRTPLPAGFDLRRALLDTWTSRGNRMGVDFDLFSSLRDARAHAHPWRFCNYDDAGVGFPRDCAPTHFTAHQWSAMPDSRHAGGRRREVRYSIEAPGAGRGDGDALSPHQSPAATSRAILRQAQRQEQQAARQRRQARKAASGLLRAVRAEGGVAALFGRADADADGELTAEEFADFAAAFVPSRRAN